MTVFLTTHYLEEAEKATDVVIMDKGSIIAQGAPNDLKNLYSCDNIILRFLTCLSRIGLSSKSSTIESTVFFFSSLESE